ncbi:gluconate 2-dehydrogenase subunit 3 family protein [Chitinophaga sp.]|uniref:gluconate 2-dehydrogenase subunit 3 family protein n=1 Tax=Chitinophaga sp. TaxID=1869181 RepID=UPI0031D18E39
MLVSRRTVLKQVLFVSAGLAVLPSCLHEKKPPAYKVKNIELSSDEEATLTSLADVMIPNGEKPGARQVQADVYAMTLMDDCYTKADQEKFKTGLQAFRKEWKNGDEAFLKKMEETAPDASPASAFYHTYKGLLIQGYTGSEYYLTKVFPYELVPGRFHGSVLVNKG